MEPKTKTDTCYCNSFISRDFTSARFVDRITLNRVVKDPKLRTSESRLETWDTGHGTWDMRSCVSSSPSSASSLTRGARSQRAGDLSRDSFASHPRDDRELEPRRCEVAESRAKTYDFPATSEFVTQPAQLRSPPHSSRQPYFKTSYYNLFLLCVLRLRRPSHRTIVAWVPNPTDKCCKQYTAGWKLVSASQARS